MSCTVEPNTLVYGIPKEKIVSFAANVNPLGISGKMKRELAEHLDVVTSYPDREYKALRETIADYTGSTAERVLVGNGSTELISLFIRILFQIAGHPRTALFTFTREEICIEHSQEGTVGIEYLESFHVRVIDLYLCVLPECDAI